jgi:hypothetical protein
MRRKQDAEKGFLKAVAGHRTRNHGRNENGRNRHEIRITSQNK